MLKRLLIAVILLTLTTLMTHANDVVGNLKFGISLKSPCNTSNFHKLTPQSNGQLKSDKELPLTIQQKLSQDGAKIRLEITIEAQNKNTLFTARRICSE